MESDRKELMPRGTNSLAPCTGACMPIEMGVALRGLQQPRMPVLPLRRRGKMEKPLAR